MEQALTLLALYSLTEGISKDNRSYNPADALIRVISEYQIKKSMLTDDPSTIIVDEEELDIPDSHKNFDGPCKPGDFVFIVGIDNYSPQVYRLGEPQEFCENDEYFGFLVGTAKGLAEYIDKYLDDEIEEVVATLAEEEDENGNHYTFDYIKKVTLDYLKTVKN